jgi:O-antigen ligase
MVLAIFLAWQTVLPASVVDRIQMTETPSGQLEHSAGGRLLLWEHALNLFHAHPVFGIGFGGFSMSAGGIQLRTGEELPENQDVHSFYMRTLSESGVIGITLLLYLLFKSFLSGWRLYSVGETPFYKGLGFGFMGCVMAVAITNLFGDRWSYFALGGYFWIFWALVDRAVINVNAARQLEEKKILGTT